MGSTRVARRAGMSLARSATASSPIATPPNVSGSVALTSNSRPAEREAQIVNECHHGSSSRTLDEPAGRKGHQ